MTSIEPISRSKRDLSRFFDVADRVYGGDPNWVPPLREAGLSVLETEDPTYLGLRELSGLA